METTAKKPKRTRTIDLIQRITLFTQLAAMAVIAWRIPLGRVRAALIALIGLFIGYAYIWNTWEGWLLSGYATHGVLMLIALWLLRLHGQSDWWSWAGLTLYLIAIFFMNVGWIENYQLARVGIYILIPVMWKIAKTTYDGFALGLAAYGASMLASLVVKYSMPQWERVTASYVDPLIFLAMLGMWLIEVKDRDSPLTV